MDSGKLGLRMGRAVVAVEQVLRRTLKALFESAGVVPDKLTLVPDPTWEDTTRDLFLQALGKSGISDVEWANPANLAKGFEVSGSALYLSIGHLRSTATVVDNGVLSKSIANIGCALWDADQRATDRVALEMLREHGMDADDDESLRSDLTAQLSALRRDSADAPAWELSLAGAEAFLDTASIAESLAPVNENLSELITRASGGSPQLIVIITQEAVWPGLIDYLESVFGAEVQIADDGPWTATQGTLKS
jgi:hypothetical protein